MGTTNCLLHRIVAAWKVLIADEFIVMTKKHCVKFSDECSGVELRDACVDFVKSLLQ